MSLVTTYGLPSSSQVVSSSISPPTYVVAETAGDRIKRIDKKPVKDNAKTKYAEMNLLEFVEKEMDLEPIMT